LSLYKLEKARTPDWGDYSDILVSGMTAHLGREDGMLQLERTGPFMPPITFPGIEEIVVTNQFRESLEHSGLTGFTFRPVVKKHIVLLEWEKWDRTADEPVIYPESGEPEDYVLEGSHSPEVARQLGEVWEVCLEEHAKFEPGGTLANWDGTDWFRVKGPAYNYVSERAKHWLEKVAPDWVTFREALTK